MWDEVHEGVAEGVTDAIERGGVEEFKLYVRDDIGVCILECADLEAYLAAIDGDEAVTDWERCAGRFKKVDVDADANPEAGILFMKRIWRSEPDAE